MKIKRNLFLLFFILNLCPSIDAAELISKFVKADFSHFPMGDDIWKGAREETIKLMAQPMAIPRPKETNTSEIYVKTLNDGKWIAFRIRWKDTEKNEAGRLGQFSDALALEFPVKSNLSPPPIFMGAKDNPVHVFHWRAQYQADKERGKPTMKDLYPNMNVDIYPMEFQDQGYLMGLTEEKREVFSHGMAAGNPQSYRKIHGVDEIFAEGFGSSSVIENVESIAQGAWKNNEWDLVLSRSLKRENGSILESGKGSFVGFAVWQGGKDEVGSRKSVTMNWTPLKIQAE